jgi:RimJ/RimL family protein N-acetyltransferase
MQDKEAPPIETERLTLLSLSVRFLRALSEQGQTEAQKLVDYCIPSNCLLSSHRQITHRINLIENDPAQHPWMYRAMITKEDPTMVGFISFHHKAPDPDLCDHSGFGVELGYTVEERYRRKGYAKESAIAVMEWANHEYGVQEFFLTISPKNRPSLAMAESMGFIPIGRHQDPTDGVELLMKASAETLAQS